MRGAQFQSGWRRSIKTCASVRREMDPDPTARLALRGPGAFASRRATHAGHSGIYSHQRSTGVSASEFLVDAPAGAANLGLQHVQQIRAADNRCLEGREHRLGIAIDAELTQQLQDR